MAVVNEILDYINELAPFSLQESYDNSGLIIGNCGQIVKKALVALDVTKDVACEAVQTHCDLIITHHPVIFHPIKRIDTMSIMGMLVKNDIAVISAHTNFDAARGGMNDVLCGRLGLKISESLACENGVDIGYVCDVDEISAEELARNIKTTLSNEVVRFNDCCKKIKRVAVLSGSGGGYVKGALAKGCDAMITGDIKHDVFVDAYNAGIQLFDAGHYHTEKIFSDYMAEKLKEKFTDMDVQVPISERDILSYI